MPSQEGKVNQEKDLKNNIPKIRVFSEEEMKDLDKKYLIPEVKSDLKPEDEYKKGLAERVETLKKEKEEFSQNFRQQMEETKNSKTEEQKKEEKDILRDFKNKLDEYSSELFRINEELTQLSYKAIKTNLIKTQKNPIKKLLGYYKNEYIDKIQQAKIISTEGKEGEKEEFLEKYSDLSPEDKQKVIALYDELKEVLNKRNKTDEEETKKLMDFYNKIYNVDTSGNDLEKYMN